MDVVLQSRTPEHGLGRHHPETAAGHGRVDLLLTATENGGITGTRMARGDESVCHRVRGSIYRQCCVTIGNRLAGTGRPSPLAAKVDASLTHKNSDTPELRGRPNDRGAECHLVLSPRLLDKLLHRKP